VDYFKPRGIPLAELEEVILTLDEYEAIRLADLDGLYQEEAAKHMNVSRQTFGNIINSAHGKLAEAIINGKALKIYGGTYEMPATRKFQCSDCSHTFESPFGAGRPAECPNCKKANIHRTEDDRGHHGQQVGCGRGRCHRGGRS
jgi:predicted DNA-binding protein (UPF0251 family)